MFSAVSVAFCCVIGCVHLTNMQNYAILRNKTRGGNMAGAQNKRNSPGAFRSCLIPYQEQIFTWWFDERKSAREIQTLQAEQYGLEVHWSTITRFIKVRSRKPDPHERPSHLKQSEKETDSPVPEIRKGFLEILMNSTPQELGRMADEAREREKDLHSK